MEWECWCAAGDIFHWLMAPLSVLSSLLFLTLFFSLSEKEFLSYSEAFLALWALQVCDKPRILAHGDKCVVRNFGHVKCQVSECFWGAFRAYSRNYLRQWGQYFTGVAVKPPRQTNHRYLQRFHSNICFYSVNSTFPNLELWIPGLNNLEVFPCNYSWLMLNVIG